MIADKLVHDIMVAVQFFIHVLPPDELVKELDVNERVNVKDPLTNICRDREVAHAVV